MPKSLLVTFFVFLGLALISVVLVFSLGPRRSGSLSKSDCKIGGCSGELCLDAAAADVASICVYKEEWACYKSATCEVQTDGRCGWTQTSELNACLATVSQICGGFANLPCPAGYTCRLYGDYPDASGRCIK